MVWGLGADMEALNDIVWKQRVEAVCPMDCAVCPDTQLSWCICMMDLKDARLINGVNFYSIWNYGHSGAKHTLVFILQVIHLQSKILEFCEVPQMPILYLIFLS